MIVDDGRLVDEFAFTLELAASAGDAEFSFKAGQFNMLYLYGVGEVPISISGDSARPNVLVHTVRSVGAVTQSICSIKKNGVLITTTSATSTACSNDKAEK